MVGDVAVIVCLVLAGALALISAIGLALGATVYDRLHYLGPPSVGAILLAIALWIDGGPSSLALKATLVALVVLATSPVSAHVIARSARIREHGDWRWRQ
jgi:monovalent cation/proton antiporter MnhG/PhaG subunit